MKFIKCKSIYSGKPMWINPKQVVRIWETKEGDYRLETTDKGEYTAIHSIDVIQAFGLGA